MTHLRQLLGAQLAGIVADCGFTSHASLTALLTTGVPFILGFARSRPIRARLAGLSPPAAALAQAGPGRAPRRLPLG